MVAGWLPGWLAPAYCSLPNQPLATPWLAQVAVELTKARQCALCTAAAGRSIYASLARALPGLSLPFPACQVDPCRLKGLEVYSTVLWHCKREVELAQLAQTASSLDRQSPYAWCVLGNCFSLQKVRGARQTGGSIAGGATWSSAACVFLCAARLEEHKNSLFT